MEKEIILPIVQRCQRCGANHLNLKFVLLANTVDEWKYWTMCPLINQPILMELIKDFDDC